MPIEVKTGPEAIVNMPELAAMQDPSPLYRDRSARIVRDGSDILHILHRPPKTFTVMWGTNIVRDTQAIKDSYLRLRAQFPPQRILVSPEELRKATLEESEKSAPGVVLVAMKKPEGSSTADIEIAAQAQSVRHIDEFMQPGAYSSKGGENPLWLLQVGTEYWTYTLSYPPSYNGGIFIVEGQETNNRELIRLFQQTAVSKVPEEERTTLVETMDLLLDDYPPLLH